MNWEHIPRNGLTLQYRLWGDGTKLSIRGLLSGPEVILAFELQVLLLLDDMGVSRKVVGLWKKHGASKALTE